MAGALAALSARLPTESIRIGPRWIAAFGISLMAFGWLYPHFLNTASWVTYLYAAPLGLLPCPTLIAAIGFALVVDGLSSRPWSMVLAGVRAGLWHHRRIHSGSDDRCCAARRGDRADGSGDRGQYCKGIRATSNPGPRHCRPAMSRRAFYDRATAQRATYNAVVEGHPRPKSVAAFG